MSRRRRVGGVPACQCGAAAIEFQIISFMVLVPLLMGVLQLGLLIVAKNTVNVATLAAARAGAASGGDKAAMNHALVLGLAPLHVSVGKRATGVGMNDISSLNYAGVMAATLVASKLDTALYGRISVLNPTTKSFADFGVNQPGVGRVIPVINLMDNATVGGASGQTRAEALLLKIEVRYCQELVVPVIDRMITGVLNGIASGASLEDRACYLLNRVPVSSQAVVRMTVAPVQKALL
jgi:hypothetical protein